MICYNLHKRLVCFAYYSSAIWITGTNLISFYTVNLNETMYNSETGITKYVNVGDIRKSMSSYHLLRYVINCLGNLYVIQ